MRLVLYAFAVLMIAACAHRFSGDTYTFDYIDNVDNKRFDIRIKSEVEYDLCITPANWPNATGKVDYASEIISVRIQDYEKNYGDINTGYCPGCEIVIPPHGHIVGFLLYEDFGISEDESSMEKRLIMSPNVYRCGE